tara:strand:- start:85 stop:300 length:216 start_codon:yes stop_codon:yes gene_type:complete
MHKNSTLSIELDEKSNKPTPSENQYLKSPKPFGRILFNLIFREKLNHNPKNKNKPINLSKKMDFDLNIYNK